jgi:NAD(P)H dehydrogenase (quinone)
MNVIFGATGQTGRVVAKTLLEQKQPVRVVVRDAARGAEWKQRGAEVAVAALDDTQAVARALEGAEGAYLLVPPDYGAPSMLAAQRRVVDTLAAAPRPKHVVLLSSVGAQLAAGTGPIRTLRYAEEKLRPDTALRAAYFMENWASLLGVVREQSILPSSLSRRISMVATEDIGRTAAQLLVEKQRGVVELAGPEDYSPEEVAATLARILGRDIQLVPIPEPGIVPSLKAAGLSDDIAELFREMTVGLNDGTIDWTGKPRRGRVPLETVLRQLLK